MSGWTAYRVGDAVRHRRFGPGEVTIAKGAKEKMWCTRWEVDYGLRWEHSRECWVGDGHRYDGSRFAAEQLRGRS